MGPAAAQSPGQALPALPPPGAPPDAPPSSAYAPPPPGYAAPGGYYAPQGGYYAPPGGYYAPQVVLPPPGSPAELPYDGGPVPAGYHLRKRNQTGLIAGGAATFGGLYLITVVAGALAGAFSSLATATCDLSAPSSGTWGNGSASVSTSPSSSCASSKDFRPMYIPLAGPWIAMKTAHADAGGGLALGLLGVGQATGLGLLIAGLATRETKLVRNDLAVRGVRVVPAVGPRDAGLSLVGSF